MDDQTRSIPAARVSVGTDGKTFCTRQHLEDYTSQLLQVWAAADARVSPDPNVVEPQFMFQVAGSSSKAFRSPCSVPGMLMRFFDSVDRDE